ncbi:MULTISPECIES: SPOUT family RNA methylase [unclassified Archaeoglobus]|jgi:tRNA acetyltransferase TAN1|uniref:SPOUT family RNA methylase n=1 Tax=unclassified Archaeoglobus TaxID=2643606 RepID=UPI0025BAFE74|nr:MULTISPECIES: SPOUT family RNA methylase [unclassified Archaeoglobus]
MLLIKTQRGMEYVAASHIKDAIGDVKIEVRPSGFLGLLIVHCDENLRDKLDDIPEIETIIPVLTECNADLDEIISKAEIIAEKLKDAKTFAIRTKRRGTHDFSSLDVNLDLGDRIRELTGCEVDLNFPDKSVYVEIINKRVLIGVVDGSEERKKYTPEKVDSRKLFGKISFVQMPYLEDTKAALEIGERVGRAAQAFEIKELIIAPHEYVNAFELEYFIKGVRRGQLARYKVQEKAYAREVRKVPVFVRDIYQTARDKRRRRNVLIVTDPTGKQLSGIRDELVRKMKFADEIVVFAGSRVGVPKGLFRLADFVIDLAPYITFATEQTIPVTLSALLTIFEDDEERAYNP